MPRDEEVFESAADQAVQPGREAFEASMRRRRMLADWAWSQTIAPQPLPMCLVTGI